MTLRLAVPDAEFAKLVQDALTKICGCSSVRVDLATGAISVGNVNCTCYCDHRAGCNMLIDLVTMSRAVRIFRSADSSGYDPNQVWWFPVDEDFEDDDVCGGTLIPEYIVLAHELVHAVLETVDEPTAVRGENQIRLERCMPMRMEYGNATVANFRVGVLDASNRPAYDCTCSACRGGIFTTLRRWWCALHSMYCFPGLVWVYTVLFGQDGGMRASPGEPVDERIARAREIRKRLPMAAEVDHAALLPDADVEIVLDHVGLQGVYRAVVIAVKDDAVHMLTNCVPRLGGPPHLGPPGTSLVLSRGISQSLADAIRARVAAFQFADGDGGPNDAADGAVHFLKCRSGNQWRSTALYFYHYPATADSWTRPAGVDGPRWDAVDAVYETWRELAASPVMRQP